MLGLAIGLGLGIGLVRVRDRVRVRVLCCVNSGLKELWTFGIVDLNP